MKTAVSSPGDEDHDDPKEDEVIEAAEAAGSPAGQDDPAGAFLTRWTLIADLAQTNEALRKKAFYDLAERWKPAARVIWRAKGVPPQDMDDLWSQLTAKELTCGAFSQVAERRRQALAEIRAASPGGQPASAAAAEYDKRTGKFRYFFYACVRNAAFDYHDEKRRKPEHRELKNDDAAEYRWQDPDAEDTVTLKRHLLQEALNEIRRELAQISGTEPDAKKHLPKKLALEYVQSIADDAKISMEELAGREGISRNAVAMAENRMRSLLRAKIERLVAEMLYFPPGCSKNERARIIAEELAELGFPPREPPPAGSATKETPA